MFKHYTMNQVVLPLDLEIKLQENDIAFTINELVESIPEEAFQGFVRQTGRPSYHPRMMMKIILCAYTQTVWGPVRKMRIYNVKGFFLTETPILTTLRNS